MTTTLAVQRDDLTLARDGAQLFRDALDSATLALAIEMLAAQPQEQAGVRLFGVTALHALLAPGGPLASIVRSAMRATPVAVRAILFDKTAKANWSLAWHQDRVVAVKARADVEGFGPWTRKLGVLHVAPPFEVLSRMTTLRLHLDPTPADNAPLLIAPGSHRLGRIAERDIPIIVERCGTLACVAEAGDVWLYATPILHASGAAWNPTRRRVLQVDFAADSLPGGLEWQGI